MSLQIWLPLNGNINNYGVSTATVTNNGATVNSSGKIGSCYSFDGSDDYISIDSASLRNLISGGSNPFSFSFWIYHADSTRAIIFGDYNLSGTISFNIELNTSHNVRFYWGNDPDLTFSNSSVSINVWSHVSITYSGSELKCYINGNLVDSISITLSTKTKSSGVYYLGRDNRTGSTALNGRLNDFRFYDHCLSYSEVKEISKALVAYYPLRNNITAYSNQIKNATYNIYNNYGVSASLTKLNELYMGCVVYRLSMTPNSSAISSFRNSLGNQGVYGFSRTFSANTKYCFWMYYRPITYSDTIAGGTASNIGGWTEIPPEYMGDGWYRSGQYRDGSVTSDKSDNIFFSMRSPSAAVDTPFVVDFACPSLVLYTDEIQDVGDYQEVFLGRVSDCSGYNRSGSVTTSSCPSVVYDSPRYSNSYHFDSNAKNLSLNSSFLPTFTTGSVEWWAKVVTNGSSGTLPFTGQSTSYYIAASSGWTGAFYNGTTSAASGYSIKYYIDGVEDNTPNGPDGKWHHYVVTGLDMSGWTALWLNNYGGSSSWNASDIFYSDIKFYNTVLSAEDVSQEYHTYASIYNNQTLKACEFIESNANLLEPTNTTLTRKVWTSGLSSYTQSNCSCTLTDDGYRIYRGPNLNPTDNGNTMWGGLVIKPYNVYNRDMLIKGHTYILKWHVKGQSSNSADTDWSNNVGWGGHGLSPSPSNVTVQTTPSDFQGEMECFYKWTINDDVYKVCTSSYSSFVEGNTYLSYRDFKFGFGYTNTGSLGTDLYITNIRMYDITDGNVPVKISIKGVCYGNLVEENFDKVSFNQGNEIYAKQFIEI